MRSADGEGLGPVLGEQAAYYRAMAEEYYDHYLNLPGGAELAEALEAFRPAGSVLELACGRGAWTGQLLRHAADVTAVDASPESGSACTRQPVIHSDDPDHPVVTIDVSAMTKMTLGGAVQGWLAGKLQSLLATQIDRPCDEGTFGTDDKEC